MAHHPATSIRSRHVLGAAATLGVGLLIAGCGTSARQAPTQDGAHAVGVAVAPQVERLAASAQATQRVLDRTSRAGDLAGVRRMAVQQMAVVQKAQTAVMSAPAADGRARTARGTLIRAMGAHRDYLRELSRLTALPPDQATERVRLAARDAQAARAAYGNFARLTFDATTAQAIALGDVSGVRMAVADRLRADRARAARELAARQAAERREAARAAAARPSYSPGYGPAPSSGDSHRQPVVSSVVAVDQGSTLGITASYCDRTPGSMNDFRYTFLVMNNGYVVAQDSYMASQTRACNGVSMSFTDNLPNGTYLVVVRVDNLTNGVAGEGGSTISVY